MQLDVLNGTTADCAPVSRGRRKRRTYKQSRTSERSGIWRTWMEVHGREGLLLTGRTAPTFSEGSEQRQRRWVLTWRMALSSIPAHLQRKPAGGEGTKRGRRNKYDAPTFTINVERHLLCRKRPLRYIGGAFLSSNYRFNDIWEDCKKGWSSGLPLIGRRSNSRPAATARHWARRKGPASNQIYTLGECVCVCMKERHVEEEKNENRKRKRRRFVRRLQLPRRDPFLRAGVPSVDGPWFLPLSAVFPRPRKAWFIAGSIINNSTPSQTHNGSRGRTLTPCFTINQKK